MENFSVEKVFTVMSQNWLKYHPPLLLYCHGESRETCKITYPRGVMGRYLIRPN